jgi:protein tyrosine phosphatase (PTP) superfamily phosphohydrolase (DUF442 family)
MSFIDTARDGIRILWERLTQQGVDVTWWWFADHIVRRATGAPIQRVSQITPQLHVGGQYSKRGWPILQSRGVTAVVNMRDEFDSRAAGLAPPNYLYLPTIDDHAPTLEQLREGTAFIAGQVANGGGVYIHCKSGVGRAATMAAAYLMSTGLSQEEAWTRIRASRPFVRPTAVQLQQLDRLAS